MAEVLPTVNSTPLLVSAAPYPHPPQARATHSDPNNAAHDGGDEEKWIWVLDPMTRKLRVPVHLLHPTQATATSGTVPSLCIAYLEGRCRHPWCRQAHVLPSAIPQLRYEALNAPTCCHLHNDPHDITKLTNRFRYIRIVNNGPSGDSELIPTSRVASTVGLLRYLVHNVLPKKNSEDKDKEKTEVDTNSMITTPATATGTAHESNNRNGATPGEDDVLELPAKFICRLHLAHRCRYLEDCNNIHLCREYELQLQPPPHILGALNGVTTSTRTVTVGDTCYTVTPLAVGEVSEEDFRAISEAQKLIHHNKTANSINANATHNASSMPWAVSANPFDSAVPSTTGNSPMLYAHGGNAAMTPLSVPANANGGTTMFPSMPDCWQTPSAMSSAAPGNSPFLQSSTSHYTTSASTRLRVYDVRPKNSASASNGHGGEPSSCNASITTSPPHNPNSNTVRVETNSARAATVATTTTTTPSASTPGSINGICSNSNEEKNSVSTSTAGHTTHVVGLGKHAVTVCGSTDGDASISTSGANTPVTDGDFTAFLQRMADTRI